MKVKFGDNEFSIEQFKTEFEDLFGYSDPKIKKEYVHRALTFGQIQKTESENFIATPKNILTPSQRLTELRGKRNTVES